MIQFLKIKYEFKLKINKLIKKFNNKNNIYFNLAKRWFINMYNKKCLSSLIQPNFNQSKKLMRCYGKKKILLIDPINYLHKIIFLWFNVIFLKNYDKSQTNTHHIYDKKKSVLSIIKKSINKFADLKVTYSRTKNIIQIKHT